MKLEKVKKDNKRRNILIVLAVLILLLIFVGVTYSFYSANVKFVNKSQTIIKTNELSLIYTGVKEITTGDNMIPGDSFTKTFTVENTSSVDTTFNIYMENVTNEFNEDLVYVLSDDNGVVVEELSLPVTNTAKSYLISNINIKAGELKTYTIKIEFKYLDTPQNDYQGKYFKGTVGIDTSKVENILNPEDAEKNLSTAVALGDYIEMTPTSLEYEIDGKLTGHDYNQKIYPSELNVWRVIKINDDSTIEVISEKVSSTLVKIYGKEGFKNYVGLLNEASRQYANLEYTLDPNDSNTPKLAFREIGYYDQTEYFTDDSIFPTTAPFKERTFDNSNEVVGGGDISYIYDVNSVQEVLGTLVAYNPNGDASEYWLASREYAYISDKEYTWHGRNVSPDGEAVSSRLYCYYNAFSSLERERGLRPIITLKSNLTATGSGTEASPYKLK